MSWKKCVWGSNSAHLCKRNDKMPVGTLWRESTPRLLLLVTLVIQMWRLGLEGPSAPRARCVSRGARPLAAPGLAVRENRLSSLGATEIHTANLNRRM